MICVTPEICATILQNFCGRTTEVINYQIQQTVDKCGFLGDYCNLRISYRESGKERRASFFVKGVPSENENQKKYVEEIGVFEKELMVYENLLGRFLKLTKKEFAPRCYYTDADKKWFVLEDLKEQKYETRRSPLGDDECVSVLKTMAEFHAATIIFEEKRSENEYRLDQHFDKELEECTFSFVEGHPRYKWYFSAIGAIAECVCQLVPFIEKERLLDVFKGYIEKLPNLLKPSRKYRNVLIHDDLWCNNILFKSDGNILKSAIVDFQLVRYMPPALDVIVFLYLNVDGDELKENLMRYLKIYFDCFTKELSEANISPENIYTWKGFLDSIEEYMTQGLFEAALYGTNVFINQETAKNILIDETTFENFMYGNRASIVRSLFQQDEKYKKRMTDVIIPLLNRLIKF